MSVALIQDRTVEFQQCVNNFNRINRAKGKGKGKHANANAASKVSKSEFSSRAGTIAKDIAHATELLGKLALLAKRKPLFDDNPVEIAELTYVIKQDIFKIEKQLKDLQQYSNTGVLSSNNKSQISVYSKNVLQILNTKTKNMSGEFKNVLELRQKNEIESKERRNQFLAKLPDATGKSPEHAMSSQSGPGSVASGGAGAISSTDNPFLVSLDDPDTSVPTDSPYLSIPEQTQQVALLEDQSSEYLRQRSNAIESIESTINEVGDLFAQLSSLVSEQGNTITRIDGNVDDIEMNIEGAQRELMKYYNTISNNRWLYLKIFSVLVFFFFLWVMVS